MNLKDYSIAALLLILFALVLNGCQSNSKPDAIKGSESIRYFHDERTDLCFAAMNSSTYGWYNVTSITNVPCTDKVQAIIHQ